jgi:hypothetical protein
VPRSKAEVTRRVAKAQAELSRSKGGGALGLTNKDKIKLSHASLENTMLANRQEAQNTNSNNKKRK